MARAMPAVSYQSKLRNMNSTLMASTISRILMTGSEKLAINWEKKPLRFFWVIRFSPYWVRLRRISWGESPRSTAVEEYALACIGGSFILCFGEVCTNL